MRTARLTFLAATALALLLAPRMHAAPKWADIDPADLAATRSTAAGDSDLEILFSRHTLSGDATHNYIRVKVYTAIGIDRLRAMSIDETTGAEISRLAARVVKPSGSSTELAKADFHKSVRWKAAGIKATRTTFAFPGIEPGDIVEYQWDQKVPLLLFSYYRVFVQDEQAFTREYTFQVKSADMNYNVIWSQCPGADFDQKTRKLSIRNVPAFIAEPYMPPQADLRASVTTIFTHPLLQLVGMSADWPTIGRVVGELFMVDSAPDKAVRAKAAELTAGSPSIQDSVRRLYQFVQREIKNLDTDDSPDLAAAKKKRARSTDTQKPARTLAQRHGTTWDITVLFASLVRATGLVAHVGMSADRQEVQNLNVPNGWIFADRRIVLVDYGTQMGFYTPAEPLVPFGMLSRKDEGASMYLCDPIRPRWLSTPIATAADNRMRRTGRFALDADGNLDGSVELELTGHHAMDSRTACRDRSPADALDELRASLVERLPTAEPSDLSWSNAEDTAAPFVLRYKVRVPGYAESAGSRLVFPINYFAANEPAKFPAETRRYPIYLGLAEQCDDDIQLILPDGYELDGANSPPWLGDAGALVFNRYEIKFDRATRTLIYDRKHTLGGNGMLSIRSESYGTLRRIFNQVHRSDQHRMVLKRPEAAASTGGSELTP